MKGLLLALNIFISSHTSFPIINEYPSVTLLSQVEMNWIFLGCKGEDKWFEPRCRKKRHAFYPIGLYDAVSQKIYISKNFKNKSTKEAFHSVILHELVHHLQNKLGVLRNKKYCRGQHEVQAYRLQQLYLESHEQDFYKSININELFIRSLLVDCFMQ